MMTTFMNRLGRWGLGCGMALTALAMVGCQSTASDSGFAEVLTPNPVTAAPAQAAAPGVTTAPMTGTLIAPDSNRLDRLNAGDVVIISVKDLPIYYPDMEERIKQDGTITLLQNQTFVAAGKTRGELEKEIRDRYVPRFFVTMTVSVRHQKDTQFIFVGGEVKAPGRQVYISRMTVTKAIQSAGDFTAFANRKKVRLTRQNGKMITINCVKASTNPELDLEVYPGDKIEVVKSLF